MRRKGIAALAGAAVALLGTALVPGAALAVPATDVSAQQPVQAPQSVTPIERGENLRWGGDTRYDTAVTVSRNTFEAPLDVVYIAVGSGFADMLAAGPIAAAQGAPILLAPGHEIPLSVRHELERLSPKKIVVLGGSNTISRITVNRLGEYADTVERIAGSNRYATAAKLVATNFTDSERVYLASGEKFADGLAAGAAAAEERSPLLLASSAGLTGNTGKVLRSLSPTQVVIVGDESELGKDVVEDVENAVPGVRVTRYSGEDRYETSAELADAHWPDGADTAVYANGRVFSDALIAVPSAAANDAPLLLTKKTCVPESVFQAVEKLEAESTAIVGGAGAIKADTRSESCSQPAPQEKPAQKEPVAAIDDPAASIRAADGVFETVEKTSPQVGTGRLWTYTVETEKGLPDDPALFGSKVRKILSDKRSWAGHDGVAVKQVADSGEADFAVQLTSPQTTDKLCAPLRTQGYVSCATEVGGKPTAVINQNRWNEAVPHFDEKLELYRQMVINHEVGHLLGHGHQSCPAPGDPAPVMQQQTYSLQGCTANAWPY